MQKSLMPKGVDHATSASESKPAPRVQKSLMPKGVDHNGRPGATSEISHRVQKSLMPKGVDHWQARFLKALPASAKIFDAERR